MNKQYRVVAKSRATGKEFVYNFGDSAIYATDAYEDLLTRKMFMGDFKIRLEVMEPVIIQESE